MPVYKIFASKDATIYSEKKTLNSGMDAILELTKQPSVLYQNTSGSTQNTSGSTAARVLIQFSDTDIQDVYNSYIKTNNHKTYLKLYLANASEIPTDFTIACYPLYQSWDMGTGRYSNLPVTTNGVSWLYRTANSTNQWQVSLYPVNVTGSYLSDNPGGGSWYSNYPATQSFGVYTEKDVELDVSAAVDSFISGTISNNGFIIMNSGSIEFDKNYSYILNYFSRDTNTVYPPVLEFRWDDTVYTPNTSSMSLVSSPDIRVSLRNNKGEYEQNSVQRFRINVRDQYPTRTFTTSSIYTTEKYLPSSSYFSIKDVKSDLTIIDFDNNYTKIGADSNGSYFDVYMYGLEPERYYKILIKTVIQGSTLVFDDNQFFKVKE